MGQRTSRVPPDVLARFVVDSGRTASASWQLSRAARTQRGRLARAAMDYGQRDQLTTDDARITFAQAARTPGGGHVTRTLLRANGPLRPIGQAGSVDRLLHLDRPWTPAETLAFYAASALPGELAGAMVPASEIARHPEAVRPVLATNDRAGIARVMLAALTAPPGEDMTVTVDLLVNDDPRRRPTDGTPKWLEVALGHAPTPTLAVLMAAQTYGVDDGVVSAAVERLTPRDGGPGDRELFRLVAEHPLGCVTRVLSRAGVVAAPDWLDVVREPRSMMLFAANGLLWAMLHKDAVVAREWVERPVVPMMQAARRAGVRHAVLRMLGLPARLGPACQRAIESGAMDALATDELRAAVSEGEVDAVDRYLAERAGRARRVRQAQADRALAARFAAQRAERADWAVAADWADRAGRNNG
jgi:hypothetical protein